MAKRAHSELLSPESDSEELRALNTSEDGDDGVPLLPLRPPSVDSTERLEFGSRVDGVPVSLPMPQLRESRVKAQSGGGTVSPTAVTATPLGKRAKGNDGGLEAIPEAGEDAEAVERGPIDSQCLSSAGGDNVVPTGGAGRRASSELDAAAVGDSSRWPAHREAAHKRAADADHNSDSDSSDCAAHGEVDDEDGAGTASLKRRKASRGEPGDDDAEHDPRLRFRARIDAEEPVQTETATVEDTGEGVAPLSSSASPSPQHPQQPARPPFKLDLEVELPEVNPSSTRFGGRELDYHGREAATPVEGGGDVPLYPLRPPSVSGCPELLRFGEEVSAGHTTPALPLPSMQQAPAVSDPAADVTAEAPRSSCNDCAPELATASDPSGPAPDE